MGFPVGVLVRFPCKLVAPNDKEGILDDAILALTGIRDALLPILGCSQALYAELGSDPETRDGCTHAVSSELVFQIGKLIAGTTSEIATLRRHRAAGA